MFKTRFSKLLTLTLLFIFLAFAGLYSIEVFQKNKKDYYLNVQSDLLATKYDTSYKYLKIMSSDIVQMYSKNKKLIQLFTLAKDANATQQANIRSSMYSSLLKNYKRLNKMGISQVHFHLPNNTSFLRMYALTKHSDDLTDTRGTVVKTNRKLTPQEGFEVCSSMSGIRFVYPLFGQGNEHLGSVEVSFSSKKLLNNITDDFTYDSHILISKSSLIKVYSEKELENNYNKSWEVANYYVDKSIHKRIGDINLYKNLSDQSSVNIHLNEKIAKGIATKKPFTVSSIYNYQNILLSYLPLSNTDGIENISYLVAYTESDYLSNMKIEINYIKLIYFLALIFFTLFIAYVIYSQEKLKVLALYDILTKLPNRTLFTIELQNEINRAYRYKNKIALLFLDLDGFKAVNDTYGHGVGDQLLIKISNIIISKIRQSDLAARLGGDEFTVILTDVNNSKMALEIAQNIINEIGKEIIIGDDIIHVGASVGIAMFPDDNEDAQTLIKYADDMMYVSKENGKNQVTLYQREENN